MTSFQPLSLELLREVNETRRDEWRARDGSAAWTGADWSNEMCGEAGEAANVVKKLRRVETVGPGAGDPDEATLRSNLADELADTVTYADLLAAKYGIDLGEVVRAKFNKVSSRQGFPERL